MSQRPIQASIREAVRRYYEEKLKAFGPTPQGVDWNSKESQYIRFSQLARLLPGDPKAAFSVMDYGCGYGEIYGYVAQRWPHARVEGYDISPAMVRTAAERYPKGRWMSEIPSGHRVDYVVASGIFNVRLDFPWLVWQRYVEEEIQFMAGLARKGIAFNMLTIYSDFEYMKDYLFYADPGRFFHFCKQVVGRRVALFHDYPLYEVTIIAYKD